MTTSVPIIQISARTALLSLAIAFIGLSFENFRAENYDYISIYVAIIEFMLGCILMILRDHIKNGNN